MITKARDCNVRKGPQAEEYKWPPEDGKDKETDFPLEPLEGTGPINTFTDLGLLAFRTVRE